MHVAGHRRRRRRRRYLLLLLLWWGLNGFCDCFLLNGFCDCFLLNGFRDCFLHLVHVTTLHDMTPWSGNCKGHNLHLQAMGPWLIQKRFHGTQLKQLDHGTKVVAKAVNSRIGWEVNRPATALDP